VLLSCRTRFMHLWFMRRCGGAEARQPVIGGCATVQAFLLQLFISRASQRALRFLDWPHGSSRHRAAAAAQSKHEIIDYLRLLYASSPTPEPAQPDALLAASNPTCNWASPDHSSNRNRRTFVLRFDRLRAWVL
jgi:hypothetical protein